MSFGFSSETNRPGFPKNRQQSEKRSQHLAGLRQDTPILRAAHDGQKNVVEKLIAEGYDVNAGGDYGRAFQAACIDGHEEIVRLLLKSGADVNAQGREFGNTLPAVCAYGHEAIVRLLLENGADVNAQGEDYGSALQTACAKGHEAIVRLLLENGADVNAQGGYYGNPLQAACISGFKALVRLLLENGADVNAYGGCYGNSLQAACTEGYQPTVKLLLKKGASINAQGGYYGSPLQAACVSCHKALARLLLKNGADVNAQGGYYGSPLQAACVSGFKALVRLLLENGADVNAQGGYYGSSLQAACVSGSTAPTGVPLKNRANPDAQERIYRKALKVAWRQDYFAIQQLLLGAGAIDHSSQGSKSSGQPITRLVQEKGDDDSHSDAESEAGSTLLLESSFDTEAKSAPHISSPVGGFDRKSPPTDQPSKDKSSEELGVSERSGIRSMWRDSVSDDSFSDTTFNASKSSDNESLEGDSVSDDKKSDTFPDNSVLSLHQATAGSNSPVLNMVLQAALGLRALMRRSIRPGQQRITWICGCGRQMFLDVEELHSGSAKSLQSEFQRAADPIVQVPDSSSYAPTLPVSSQDYAPSASRRGRSNPAQQIMLPQDTALVQGADIRSSSTRTRTFADSNTTFNRFLLMSVSTSRLPMLEHVAVLQAENDTMLFQDLRSSYLAIRTAQTERFHPGTAKWIRFLSRKLRGLISCLQKYMIRLYGILGAEGIVPWVGDNLFFVPIRADYIKFELVPVKYDVCPLVIEVPDLPPVKEVLDGKYHYRPCPQDIKNPQVLLRVPFLHVFLEPGFHYDRFWTERLPKKLGVRLEYDTTDQPIVGWGIQIIDGPNWIAFCVLSGLVCVLSLLISLVVSMLSKNTSGFEVGSYILATLSLSHAIGVLFLAQQT
ncbi:hypothetical protein MMC20_001863 [Loxospora ochrophaea]|nr:hypothetical protein [Loxospora ochrophaea]